MLHWRHQSISDLGHCLNGVLRMRIVLKDTSQFADGSNQDIISHKDILPHHLAELLPSDNIPRLSGQCNQNLHYLRLKMYCRITSIYFIEPGTN